jgi:hypothetical protein
MSDKPEIPERWHLYTCSAGHLFLNASGDIEESCSFRYAEDGSRCSLMGWRNDGSAAEARVRELEADQLIAADVLKENMLAWRAENRKLRDALFEARRKATEVVDEYARYREQNDPQVNSGQVRLWAASRVRDAISAIIDAALATKEPA